MLGQDDVGAVSWLHKGGRANRSGERSPGLTTRPGILQWIIRAGDSRERRRAEKMQARIAIVGGGPGALAAALSLLRFGFPHVRVFERAAQSMLSGTPVPREGAL